MNTLTAEHVRTPLQSTEGDWFHAPWVLLATTGLSIGEALGLHWEDIDSNRALATASLPRIRVRDLRHTAARLLLVA